MKDQHKLINEISGEINFVEVIRHVWIGRWLILKIGLISIILGIFIAFTSTKKYKVEVRLLPEFGDSGSGTSQILRQISGFSGIPLGYGLGADAIRPDLYPSILNSTPFFLNILNNDVQIVNGGDLKKISVFTYYKDYMDKTFWGIIAKYTVKLPWTLMNLLRSDVEYESFGLMNISKLTKTQLKAIRYLTNNIKTGIDPKTQIINITAEFPDPYLSAQIARYTVDYLTGYIIQYRIEKAQKELEFIQERYEEKKIEFYQAQNALARFRDANVNIISASVRTEEQRLQDQYTLSYNVFNSLSQQLENVRIKVQEKTPVIKVLEPVQIPTEKSKPRRTIVLLICMSFGILLSFIIIFSKNSWINLLQRLKEN